MSFMDAREHGSKPGSGGPASAEQEVGTASVARTENPTHTRPLCAVSAFADWHWKPSTCPRTPTFSATMSAIMNAACALPCTSMRPTTSRTPKVGCCLTRVPTPCLASSGKRHQMNLAKRAALEEKERSNLPAPLRTVAIRKTVKIGRPGYRVTKQYKAETQQRCLLFQVWFLLTSTFNVVDSVTLHPTP